jgi:NADPH-dependent 2,4-dienoyl-CoA reductase/sulfur reductase-like enzyme
LQDGETIAFDYCILTTGSTYPAGVKPPADVPSDRVARLKQFSEVAEKVGCGVGGHGTMAPCRPGLPPTPNSPACPPPLQIATAQSVVVVGGGTVGVELAAEVAEAHPGKKASSRTM